MVPLTENARTLIRILRIKKHLNAYQMINEFPARNWSKNNLNRLIRQILKGRKHFIQSVMISVAVSNLGKTVPFFFTPKAKVNSVYYCNEVLGRGLLPDMRLKSGNDFVFQQDGAPAHRSRHTVEFLSSNVPEFIEPHNWPPNSPDLNPVDYSLWGALQQRVYRERIVNVEHPKRVIIRCWTEISRELFNGAIDQWARRIDAVIRARGRHIEHLFD